MCLCILYSDIESALVNNGFASDWIKLSTGVRQGCPPIYFVRSYHLWEMLCIYLGPSAQFQGSYQTSKRLRLCG